MPDLTRDELAATLEGMRLAVIPGDGDEIRADAGGQYILGVPRYPGAVAEELLAGIAKLFMALASTILACIAEEPERR